MKLNFDLARDGPCHFCWFFLSFSDINVVWPARLFGRTLKLISAGSKVLGLFPCYLLSAKLLVTVRSEIAIAVDS